MGEIADAMLEGDLCGGCGVFMDGPGDGIPRYCSPDCSPEGWEDDASDGMDYASAYAAATKKKTGGAISALQSERDRAVGIALKLSTALNSVMKWWGEYKGPAEGEDDMPPQIFDAALDAITNADLKLPKIRGPHNKKTVDKP